jgi:hypothetical protein
MSFRSHRAWALVLALLALPATGALAQLDIRIVPGPVLQAHPDALASFELAAQQWEARISTPIRINIDAEMETVTDTNVIGSTGYGAENLNLNYTLVRNAMAARASRPGNAILASLPTSAQITANVPPEGSFDNTTIGLTRANQKALGLIPNPATDTVIDATMVFNLNFNFDYDRTDGLDSSKWDFQTVAAHEMGHALGFVSDTDDYDYDPTLFDNATTMDLFRFNKSDIPADALEFITKPREMRPGQKAVFYDLITQYELSTGATRGDGNQASHWKDDFYLDQSTNTLYIGSLIGIMDPTLGAGIIEDLTVADLRVMELIGYDTIAIPEPATIALLLVSPVLLLRRQRTL